MGAMAPPPHHWIPEDEVLLKNAVEAGASLESLAKGAVQFSRRFTVQELQDHWFSLLYDPVVAEESSVLMMEIERSAFLNQPRLSRLESVKEIATTSQKRKGESIRKRYYAMRKRICSKPFDMMGLNLLSEPDESAPDCGIVNPISNDLGIQGQDLHLHGENMAHNLSYPYEENNVSLDGQYNLFEAEGLETDGNNACPEFVGTPFPLPEIPILTTDNESQIGEKQQIMGEEDAFIIPSASEANSNLKTSLSCDSITNLVNPSTEDYFAELSNTLFDFTNEDELLFMDTDGKDSIDNSYYDGLSSLLLDSPNLTELTSDDFVSTSAAASDDNKVAINLCFEQKLSEARVASSASTVECFGPEYRNGVICCMLNTHDPEIPSNDDVFLPFRFPSPTNSPGVHCRLHHHQDPSYLVSSTVQDLSSTRKETGGPPTTKNNHKSPCVMESFQPSDTCMKYPIGDRGVKFELPKSNIQHAALWNNSRSYTECSNRISSANACANSFITGVVVKRAGMEMERVKDLNCKFVGPPLDMPDQSLQENDAKEEYPNNNASANAELSCEKTMVSEPIDNTHPQSDQAELWSENDFDMPYFSDVEAMILDMDLSPEAFDIYTNPDVQRYQHEETKRTIIRLEQAADAYMQRALAAKGAFAMLYGRWSKHFIKKPEVILGRGTGDTKVDVDLGREKNGGKISRRQAIMKMDGQGIFHLKNLGRHLIHVNGKGVAPGQSLSLISGCLIQVRSLAYVFETNRKHIRQYVDSMKEQSLFLDQKILQQKLK